MEHVVVITCSDLIHVFFFPLLVNLLFNKNLIFRCLRNIQEIKIKVALVTQCFTLLQIDINL